MKKVLCLLAVIGMVAPLYAAVDEVVTFALVPTGQDVTVSYVMADPNGVPIGAIDKPLAFGLKADITAGAACLADSSGYSSNFELYPDWIYDNGLVWGDPNDEPIADPAAAGALALGSVSSASVCMARVQETVAGPNPGPVSDTLLTLSLDGIGVATLTISADTLRGGVVATGPVATNLPQSIVVALAPDCWLCDGQDKGNATGDTAINFSDLAALKAAMFTNAGVSPWGTDLGDYNTCADFTRDGAVNFADLAAIKANFFTSGYTACGTATPACD